MKNEATLSTKGQLVVPRAIRSRLKLEPGDRLRFVETASGIIMEKVRPIEVDDPFALFTEWASPEDDEAYRDL